jgi:hypothetical protein
MSEIKTGGPAFPFSDVMPGMSLRDYFAAKAMEAVWKDIPEDVNRQRALQCLGESCYQMADAMIKAREAK